MTGSIMNPQVARAITSWGLAYIALAGIIGLELDWGRRIHPSLPLPKQIPAARLDYQVQPEFTLLALEQGFAETTARPMFTPARRPPPLAPSVQAKPAMQKGQFTLLGALITKDKSIALLREVATGKATRVEQGKEIRGITVSSIFPEKVILTQHEDTEELVIKIQPQAKPLTAPKLLAAPGVPAANQPQPASQPAASMPPAEDGQSLINRRRALRGLPPQ